MQTFDEPTQQGAVLTPQRLPSSYSPQSLRFVITPHRSMSDAAFMWFVIAILTIAVAVQLFFFMIGVWVAGVAVLLDGVFLAIAFVTCRKDRRKMETLHLDEGRIISTKFRGNGETISVEALPAFRVCLFQQMDNQYGCLRLALKSREKTVEIASDLSPRERSSLADAILSELRQRGFAARSEEVRLLDHPSDSPTSIL